MTSYVPSWASWRSTLFVYVMRSGSLRKVGVTIDPYRRLAEVRREIGTTVDLEFMASHPVRYLQRIEAAVHLELSARRVHGEWFSVTYPEAEAAVLGCLVREVREFDFGTFPTNHADVRDAVSAKAERDLEAMQKRDIDLGQWRYCTWEEAEAGHREVVAHLERTAAAATFPQ